MTTISIAMATFNGEAFLAQQLDSIAAQTRLPDRLVISDDRSTDATLAIAGRFAERAAFPVEIVRNEVTAGFSGNFARALALCDEDIVLIADQDDIWYPNKIERVLGVLDAYPDMHALIHDERILDQQSGETFARSYFDNVHALHYSAHELVSGNCTAIRGQLLKFIMPFPNDMNYDYWISWMADALCCRMILAETLQLYRRHGSNASYSILAERSPSMMSNAIRRGIPDRRPMWQDEIRQLGLIAERIVDRREEIEALIGERRVSTSLDRLENDISALRQRIQIMGLAGFRRRAEVLRLFLGGFYAHFSGWKSAVTDLLWVG